LIFIVNSSSGFFDLMSGRSAEDDAPAFGAPREVDLVFAGTHACFDPKASLPPHLKDSLAVRSMRSSALFFGLHHQPRP
jgi:hypothetical protein